MSLVLSPVQSNAAYTAVVENLRRALLLGRFLPGEKLPPERELAAQLQVSRTTLREAIRVLEGEGLIEIKRGATGGIVVRPPKLAGREFVKFLRERIQEFKQLYEYREVVEVATARLAAVRRTEENLAKISDACGKMQLLVSKENKEDSALVVAKFLAADAEFHSAIAKASGNKHLETAVEDIRTSKFLPIGAVFSKMSPKANEGHAELLAAIREQNPDLAGAAMSSHVRGTLAAIQELVGDAS